MYEKLGAREIAGRRAQFQLFVPDSTLNPAEYASGGLPRVRDLWVVGNFQERLPGGMTNWEKHPRTKMTARQFADPAGGPVKGWLYEYTSDPVAPDGFYEYKLLAEYDGADPRYLGDPCARYGGAKDQNGGFVIDGMKKKAAKPLAGRKPLQDWVIYELMLSDYARDAPVAGATPLDKVRNDMPRLAALGINAIEFMPWTAWPDEGHSWGYNPFGYFTVANQYCHDPAAPTERLNRLKDLINACHDRGIAVVLDGVFNHAEQGAPHRGFGYYWLYREMADSPYTGTFEKADFGLDLDYDNACTQQFIFDVCRYWIDEFEIDGIRFDNTLGFYRDVDKTRGLPRLLSDLRAHLADTGRDHFALILEHEWDYPSVAVTNRVGATACWLDKFRSNAREMLSARRVAGKLMRGLDAGRDFDPGRCPVTYIENHDHERIMTNAGSRGEWYRTRPWAIALFTCAGAAQIYNGQEWGQLDGMAEPGGEGRVQARPLRWTEKDDAFGAELGALYGKLVAMRKAHPALRGPDFHPRFWNDGEALRRPDLFGVDVGQGLAVYHRWGPAADGSGRADRYTVVLNFSDSIRNVVVPLNVNGPWTDLLSGWTVNVTDGRWGFNIGEHNGHVFWNRS
jgi:glycosidase